MLSAFAMIGWYPLLTGWGRTFSAIWESVFSIHDLLAFALLRRAPAIIPNHPGVRSLWRVQLGFL